ncbi:unnamed protein product [Closterium sp. NIES-65]|nr:unnamed protein product [Closterium sp. NIES-65]
MRHLVARDPSAAFVPPPLASSASVTLRCPQCAAPISIPQRTSRATGADGAAANNPGHGGPSALTGGGGGAGGGAGISGGGWRMAPFMRDSLATVRWGGWGGGRGGGRENGGRREEGGRRGRVKGEGWSHPTLQQAVMPRPQPGKHILATAMAGTICDAAAGQAHSQIQGTAIPIGGEREGVMRVVREWRGESGVRLEGFRQWQWLQQQVQEWEVQEWEVSACSLPCSSLSLLSLTPLHPLSRDRVSLALLFLTSSSRPLSCPPSKPLH